jgi:hypothetical protein
VAVDLGLEDFQPVDPPNTPPLKDWATLTDLSLSGHPAAAKGASQTPATGVGWKNAKEIQIRELRWVGGTYQENGTGPTDLPEGERTKAFNSAIKSSPEQEAKDRTDRARK